MGAFKVDRTGPKPWRALGQGRAEVAEGGETSLLEAARRFLDIIDEDDQRSIEYATRYLEALGDLRRAAEEERA